jgi:hypothetical protein
VKFSLATRKAKMHLVDGELDFRGISRRITNKKGEVVEATITEKVRRLKQHEATRLRRNLGDLNAFEPLSKPVDDFY